MKKRLAAALVLFPLLGVATLVAGSATFATVRDETWGLLASTLLFEASLIFFTALIIERLLLSEFEKRAVEAVRNIIAQAIESFRESAEQSISSILNSAFALLGSARQAGLMELLPPRADEERRDVTYLAIQTALRRGTLVKVCCTSAREFTEPLYAPLLKVLQEKAREVHAEYRIKVLLSDPDGWAAGLRGKRENPADPGWVSSDIRRALGGLTELRGLFARERKATGDGNWAVEAKFYNFFCPAWFVITDAKLFIEPYHLGDIRYRLPTADWCIGGRVWVLAFDRESEIYEAFDRFHDWLWGLGSLLPEFPEFTVTDVPWVTQD